MDVKLDIHYTTPIPMSKIAPSLDKLDNKNDNLKFSIFTTNLKTYYQWNLHYKNTFMNA